MDNNKNKHLSSLDTSQMLRKAFDESCDAQRVTIVGGDFGDVLRSSFQEALKDLKIEVPPTIIHSQPEEKPLILTEKEIEYREIEKPVIVRETEIEYREIEKPVVVKEYQIQKVEVPIIVKEIEFREVEKPIMVEKYMPLPNWIKVLLIAQTVALIAAIIFK